MVVVVVPVVIARSAGRRLGCSRLEVVDADESRGAAVHVVRQATATVIHSSRNGVLGGGVLARGIRGLHSGATAVLARAG